MDLGKYIGVPFKEKGRDISGCDCWGLVFTIYGEEYGIKLPHYLGDYSHTRQQDVLGSLIPEESKNWTEVAFGSEKEGDVIVLVMRGQPMHVGFVMEPGRMLHIEEGLEFSVVERFDTFKWLKRIRGIYRHKGLS